MTETSRMKQMKRLRQRAATPAFWGMQAWRLVRFVIITGVAFMIIYPIIIKLATCFMTLDDLRDPMVKFIPRHGSAEIFAEVFGRMRYFRTMLTTAALSLLVAVAQTAVSALSGYGLARFRFWGQSLLFGVILLILLIPPSTILTPLYVRFNYLNFFGTRISLLNTFWPFVLMSLTGLGLKNGLYIFILRQFFRGLPYELEESAYMDGAGPYRAFLWVLLPNARNMLLIVFVLSFSWQWTDSNIAPMFLQNVKIFANITASVLAQYPSELSRSSMNNIMMLLIMAPLIVMYSILQRWIIRGMETSGLVG